MKRKKITKNKAQFKVSPSLVRFGLWGVVAILTVSTVLSIVRVFSLSRTVTIDKATGNVTSAFETMFFFEPSNNWAIALWLIVALASGLGAILLGFTLADYGSTGLYYYGKPDYEAGRFVTSITFSILFIILFSPIVFAFKGPSQEAQFKAAVDYSYSDTNANKTKVYKSSYNVDEVNEFMVDFTENNENTENAQVFNMDSQDGIYPMFQMVEVGGEPHLIASTTKKIDNVDDVVDLGKISVKQMSKLANIYDNN